MFLKNLFHIAPNCKGLWGKGLCARERTRVYVKERVCFCARTRACLCVRKRAYLCVKERACLCVKKRAYLYERKRKRMCVCVCMREKVKGRERTSPWYVIPPILALLVCRSVTTQVCFNNNNTTSNNTTSSNTSNVTTLALGSWLRQRFTRAWAKRSVKDCEHEVTRSQVPS